MKKTKKKKKKKKSNAQKKNGKNGTQKKNEMQSRNKVMRFCARCLLGVLALFFLISIVFCVTGCQRGVPLQPVLGPDMPKNDVSMELEEGAVLTVDYNLTVEEMIAAGHYDRHDSQIVEKFTPYQEGGGVQEVRFVIARPLQGMSSNEIKSYLRTCGLRPANLAELLALGAQYPTVQQCYPIIALNLPFEDNHINHILYLSGAIGRSRILGLLVMPSDQENVWNTQARFLAIYEDPTGAPPS